MLPTIRELELKVNKNNELHGMWIKTVTVH